MNASKNALIEELQQLQTELIGYLGELKKYNPKGTNQLLASLEQEIATLKTQIQEIQAEATAEDKPEPPTIEDDTDCPPINNDDKEDEDTDKPEPPNVEPGTPPQPSIHNPIIEDDNDIDEPKVEPTPEPSIDNPTIEDDNNNDEPQEPKVEPKVTPTPQGKDDEPMEFGTDYEIADDVTIGGKIDTDGNFELSIGGEHEDKNKETGVKSKLEIGATVTNDSAALDVSKEWKLVDIGTDFPLFTIGVVTILFELDFYIKLALAAGVEIDWSKDFSTAIDAKAKLEAAGRAGLKANVLGIVEGGGGGSIIAALESSVKVSVRNNEPDLYFKGLVFNLDFQLDAFIGAAEWIRDFWEFLGNDPEELVYRMKGDKYSLFTYKVGEYKDGKMQGEGELGIGKDLEPLRDAIKPVTDTIKYVYEKIKELEAFIADVVDAVVEFAGECIEYSIVLFLNGNNPDALRLRMQQNALYEKAIEKALEEAKRHPETLSKLYDIQDEKKRREVLTKYVSTHAVVKEVWDKIYNENDLDGAHTMIDQIAVDIQSFEVITDKKSYFMGDTAEATIRIKSDRSFHSGQLKVILYNDKKEIRVKTYEGGIEQGGWEQTMSLDIPKSGYEASDKSAWGIKAFLDLPSFEKDKTSFATIEVKKPKEDGDNKKPQKPITMPKATIKLDNLTQTVGGTDTLTTYVELERPSDELWDKLILDTIWVQVRCNDKEAVSVIDRRDNLAINEVTKITFKNLKMPGFEHALKQYFYPTKWGGKWEIVLGAKSSQIGAETILKRLPFTAILPDEYKDYTKEQAEEYAAYLRSL